MVSHLSRLKAVSIVELLVAIGILAIGGAAIYRQMNDSDRQGRLFERQVQRDLLAYGLLQQTLACPYQALAAWTPAAEPRLAPEAKSLLYQIKVRKDEKGFLHIGVTAGGQAAPGKTAFAAGSAITFEGVKAP